MVDIVCLSGGRERLEWHVCVSVKGERKLEWYAIYICMLECLCVLCVHVVYACVQAGSIESECVMWWCVKHCCLYKYTENLMSICIHLLHSCSPLQVSDSHPRMGVVTSKVHAYIN